MITYLAILEVIGSMTNYSTGHEAEKYAAEYLQGLGYGIRELNWRTPVCEIDIVAQKDNCVFFVEVKYRSKDGQGGGLDYITPQKLKQMQFAARCWVENHGYDGDYELSAIELSANFHVTDFIETID